MFAVLFHARIKALQLTHLHLPRPIINPNTTSLTYQAAIGYAREPPSSYKNQERNDDY